MRGSSLYPSARWQQDLGSGLIRILGDGDGFQSTYLKEDGDCI